ncbi:TetR/AcrR family transcriptional regulator [Nocardioides sp. Kera G14]|uniref:TetR/AcrR family transcriptional regulator n=1 Tax=Nocardioides sp. Kera G14 TaxID=2884264 RepID=UPI001D118DF7|nr:TetR/AcrR family transcriptional regulator [Nocardioides sp. Kera G14]UDY25006.1 TetR family transcriptional regulator [Nocardioides sp. Kera G14]
MVRELRSGRARGRRAGESHTREAILDAARDQFASHGYTQTSLRSVALAAAVDPSLVTHFFGSKEGLFAAAFTVLETLPEELLSRLHGAPVGERGRLLATTYLGAWEHPATGRALRALARAAGESATAAAIVRQTLESMSTVVGLQAAMGQLFGFAVARYVIQVEPLASLSLEDALEVVVPAIEATYAGG